MSRKVFISFLLLAVMFAAVGLLWQADYALAESERELQDAPVQTGFTYQGYLTQSGTPVTGTCDFQFSL